jgi:hypothetical protein
MVRGIARFVRLAVGLALAGCIAACAAAPASAAVTVKPSTYKLAIPSPGHVTAAAVEVTVREHGRGRPPSRLSLAIVNRFALPNSVRIFYVRRRISVAPLRYELLLLAVNRASGRSSSTKASAARTQFNAGSIVLTYPSRAASGHTCGNCAKRLPASTNCKRCWFKRTVIRQVQAVNADTGSATDLGSLVSLLRAVWSNNGDTNTVFGNPSAGTPRDPTLNGGEYDDNRAFGWTPTSLHDPGPVLHAVVDDLLAGQPQKIIPDLELIGQADLNGNGVLDSSTTPGGGSAP